MTVIWKKLDAYAELHPLHDWEWLLTMGAIIPDDGQGFWATDLIESNVSVWDTTQPRPEKATHVAWYAK